MQCLLGVADAGLSLASAESAEDLVELANVRDFGAEDGRRSESANRVRPTASLLLDRQVGQGRGEARGVMQFGAAGVGTAHRGAGVDEQVQVQVRVGVVFLDVEPVVPGVELPVEGAGGRRRASTRGARRTRRSSPGTGSGCSPCIEPATIDRARSSIDSNREKNTGSTSSRASKGHRGSSLLTDGLDQAADDRVGVHPVGSGVEVEHPVDVGAPGRPGPSRRRKST